MAVRALLPVMRQEASWLSGHCGPGLAAIVAAIYAVAEVGYANVNRLRGAIRPSVCGSNVTHTMPIKSLVYELEGSGK